MQWHNCRSGTIVWSILCSYLKDIHFQIPQSWDKSARAPRWMGSVPQHLHPWLHCGVRHHRELHVSTRASDKFLSPSADTSCQQLCWWGAPELNNRVLLLCQRKACATTQYLNSAKSLLNVTAAAVAAWALAERGKELKPFWGLEKESKYNFKY